jgi:hypothetical protein
LMNTDTESWKVWESAARVKWVRTTSTRNTLRDSECLRSYLHWICLTLFVSHELLFKLSFGHRILNQSADLHRASGMLFQPELRLPASLFTLGCKLNLANAFSRIVCRVLLQHSSHPSPRVRSF